MTPPEIVEALRRKNRESRWPWKVWPETLELWIRLSDQAACDACEATGQLNGKKCTTCGGSGRLDVSEGK